MFMAMQKGTEAPHCNVYNIVSFITACPSPSLSELVLLSTSLPPCSRRLSFSIRQQSIQTEAPLLWISVRRPDLETERAGRDQKFDVLRLRARRGHPR